MSVAVPMPRSVAGRALKNTGLLALLAFVGTATAAAAGLFGNNVALAVAPTALAAIAYVFWKVPVRWTTAALLTLLLTLEVSSDADNLWHTPLVVFGDLLRDNLDRWVPGSGAKLSGLEVVLLVLLALLLYRRATGSRVDAGGRTQSAWILADAVVVYLLCVIYAVAFGLARHGTVDLVIFQVRPLVHVPLLFALFQYAFRGREDHALLAGIVVAAALIRAGLAMWLGFVVLPKANPEFIYATNHGDSLLFAVACMILVADVLERPARKQLVRCLLFLPPIFLGMVANNRRLAWVFLGMSFLAAYVIAPVTRRWKRSVTRFVVVVAPLVAGYVAAGWGSSSPVFAPVHILQTLSDGQVDSSTLYREVEDWNLAMSIREDPIMGRGFGHNYTEYMKNVDLSSIFSLYLAQPHNALLGLLMFTGIVAFSGIWMSFVIAIFLAVRSYRFATDPSDRVAALVCLAALLSGLLLVYGDLGFAFTQYQVLTALAFAIVGKLAVTTGAWPRQNRSPLGKFAPQRFGA